MSAKESASRRGGFGLILIVALVGVVITAAASGFIVASALSDGDSPAAPQAQTGSPAGNSEYDYVPFGTVFVNLAEGRLTRYVRVNVVLQAKRQQAAQLQAVIDNGKSAVLMNWLIMFLSDMELKDVMGRASINRLRREIRDGFNELLDEMGVPGIESVLFVEFNVQ